MAKRKSRILVVKTRNNGTMTDSMFFGMLRARLRNASRYWKPILACKKNARIPYIGANKRRKYSFICSECGGAFSDKEVEIHHINPVGSLRCFDDLPGFCERLFCEVGGLTCVCKTCHLKFKE